MGMGFKASLGCVLLSLAICSGKQPAASLPGTRMDTAAFSVFSYGGSAFVAGEYWNGSAWNRSAGSARLSRVRG